MSVLERPVPARLRGRVSRGISGFARKWLLFVVLVLLWELATRLSESVFFPPPSKIATAAVKLWFSGPGSQLFLGDAVFEHVLPSLARVLGGWLLSVVVGIALGTALGRSRTGMDYVGPLFAFFRAIPPPALVPVFIVLFHIGPGMQIATIIFGSLWPVLLNTVDGVRSVDKVKVETARAFRTPRRYWIGMVVLPAALPKIFAGLRLSLSIALILMAISELVGALNGIGYALSAAQRAFDYDQMWAWVVLLGILGYGFNAALLAVERRVLGWQPGRN
ncbi:ABC-type nitrate/sulfonate/bicarbonate transport system permease component [Amycolatopsis jiangsuensis]|uniref:ABC-type nitrate/sulfonate/bicarbonate transport system permease component n=1 Tax=Amycolatopsis jiangsuensis TaxID=1181879 RepID=A0A840J2W4_9PSEU|nr:ABC transporter permease [Amycolatopsis jiangsuensis]MBB4687965.1 ABC-type nitrate/sulfonate/bicarbonate transport system permease component [Amycolatopsis jiangsuensis]